MWRKGLAVGRRSDGVTAQRGGVAHGAWFSLQGWESVLTALVLSLVAHTQ